MRHHVKVLGEVARGQHDGLRRLVADVASVGVLGDHAGDATRVVALALQVLRDRGVVDLAAEVVREGVGPGLRNERRALEHAHGLLLRPEVVLARRGVKDAVGVLVRDSEGAVDALRLHLVDHPVHGLRRAVLPARPLAHVHHAAAGDLVDARLDAAKLRVVHDAVLGLVLGADRLERAAARQRLGAGGEDDHVQALLGGRDRAAQAGRARADHDDLVRLGLGDLALGNRLGRDHERPGPLLQRLARDDRRARPLRRRGAGGDVLACRLRRVGDARARGDRRDGARAREEAPATDRVLHADPSARMRGGPTAPRRVRMVRGIPLSRAPRGASYATGGAEGVPDGFLRRNVRLRHADKRVIFTTKQSARRSARAPRGDGTSRASTRGPRPGGTPTTRSGEGAWTSDSSGT